MGGGRGCISMVLAQPAWQHCGLPPGLREVAVQWLRRAVLTLGPRAVQRQRTHRTLRRAGRAPIRRPAVPPVPIHRRWRRRSEPAARDRSGGEHGPAVAVAGSRLPDSGDDLLSDCPVSCQPLGLWAALRRPNLGTKGRLRVVCRPTRTTADRHQFFVALALRNRRLVTGCFRCIAVGHRGTASDGLRSGPANQSPELVARKLPVKLGCHTADVRLCRVPTQRRRWRFSGRATGPHP